MTAAAATGILGAAPVAAAQAPVAAKTETAPAAPIAAAPAAATVLGLELAGPTAVAPQQRKAVNGGDIYAQRRAAEQAASGAKA
jgi:hypothetical protein